MTVDREPGHSLDQVGLHNVARVYWNPSTPHLYEEVVQRREGWISHLGPIVVRTGSHTGRSPHDKFVVRDSASADRVWWGKENRPFEMEKFDSLHRRMSAYLQNKDVFVQDCHAGADERYRLPLRVITEDAWHSLFARNLFRQIHDPGERLGHVPDFTVINVPRFHAIPELDGTNSEAFILISFERKIVLIGGTSYAGEIKKSVFTLLNYLLPTQNVLSMHCSCNVGHRGDTALFFGLSGTGKTTLSADPKRRLIGDDEHGWSDRGIFNFEGGCYAKVIRLSPEAEPDIYETTRRFGTVLENVGFDADTRRVDLDDDSLTENTRAAYPVSHIPNALREGTAGQPSNVIFLTADAFGVLPPISKLSVEQARYHFLSGYTAKVAGTERGVDEPQATFSACADRLQSAAGGEGHQSQGALLADQHWMDGRALRRRQPDVDRTHPGIGGSIPEREARRCARARGSELRPHGADCGSRGSGGDSGPREHLERQGRLPAEGRGAHGTLP
jgi:phosphoenolpyruvate carboxykinase (ATP)